jgi:AcrR family transcriptional regulator
MGVQERKAREKKELRQDILDAARELFVTEGYEAVSMRRIAEKIEYSPTTIYLYFKDKQELFDCICEETFLKMVDEMARLDRTSLDPVQSLRAGLRNYVDFGLRHPEHYKITFLMGDQQAGEDAVGSRRMQTGCQAFGCLREAVTACIERNCFVEADVDKVSQLLWAAVHGITSLLIVHPHFPWTEKNALIDKLIDTVLRGLVRRQS